MSELVNNWNSCGTSGFLEASLLLRLFFALAMSFFLLLDTHPSGGSLLSAFNNVTANLSSTIVNWTGPAEDAAVLGDVVDSRYTRLRGFGVVILSDHSIRLKVWTHSILIDSSDSEDVLVVLGQTSDLNTALRSVIVDNKPRKARSLPLLNTVTSDFSTTIVSRGSVAK